MTDSERLLARSSPAIFYLKKNKNKRVEDGGGDGLPKIHVHLSLPLYLFSLFVFSFSPPLTPSHFFPRIFSTLCPLSIPPHFSSSSSLLSSLRLPGEKRFCLLLVSAPSQSAFLISSYCFCLIFKCYPGPNGNPYKKRKEEQVKERETGWVLFLSRTPRQKKILLPFLRHPWGKIWLVLGGGVGVGGWV